MRYLILLAILIASTTQVFADTNIDALLSAPSQPQPQYDFFVTGSIQTTGQNVTYVYQDESSGNYIYPPVANAIIQLQDDAKNILATAKTDDTGTFSLDYVSPAKSDGSICIPKQTVTVQGRGLSITDSYCYPKSFIQSRAHNIFDQRGKMFETSTKVTLFFNIDKGTMLRQQTDAEIRQSEVVDAADPAVPTPDTPIPMTPLTLEQAAAYKAAGFDPTMLAQRIETPTERLLRVTTGIVAPSAPVTPESAPASSYDQILTTVLTQEDYSAYKNLSAVDKAKVALPQAAYEALPGDKSAFRPETLVETVLRVADEAQAAPGVTPPPPVSAGQPKALYGGAAPIPIPLDVLAKVQASAPEAASRFRAETVQERVERQTAEESGARNLYDTRHANISPQAQNDQALREKGVEFYRQAESGTSTVAAVTNAWGNGTFYAIGGGLVGLGLLGLVARRLRRKR